MDGAIYSGPILVADVADAFCTDGVWYASFRLVASDAGNHAEARAAEFVAFSVEWNARVKAGRDADSTEFERFSDLIESGAWSANLDGRVVAIEAAPVFYPGDEVSWRSSSA